MKTLKFFLLWMVMTFVMIVTWSVGAWLGNTITQTAPPPVEDPASVGFSALLVCLLNSLLWSILFWSTRAFTGLRKSVALLVYLFGTQFFLTQMETFFFSASLDISAGQVISILVAGLVMVTATAGLGLELTRRLAPTQNKIVFKPRVRGLRRMITPILLMSAFVYPLIYETFGYYIAWQNEHLHLFIPNPYMPADIAMTHFVETATSNFIWGLLIVYATNRWIAGRLIAPAAD